MYFKFICTKCGQSLKARKEAVGKKARCPHCKTAVTVPEPPADEPPSMLDLSSLSEEQAGSALPSGFPGTNQASAMGSAASSMQAPAQGAETPGQTYSQAPTSGEQDQTPGTDVNMLMTMGIGLALTIIWYLAVAMPLGDAYFGQTLYRAWLGSIC